MGQGGLIELSVPYLILIMISLEQFLRKENPDDLLEYYQIEDINKWLFETYDEVKNVSEEQFYHNKFNFSTLDTPQYWFWQEKLYERLDSSLTIYSNIFGKLFKDIKGIDEVIIDNEYSIGIKYNKDFSSTSKEFETLLNFANYFIRSKLIDGKLPNPFFIEGRKPKELIDYKYKEAYHITNKYAYEKIKKYGLLPKSKSKLGNYDDRIYLWIPKNLTKYDIEAFGRINLRLYNESIGNNDKHNLYNNIDVNKDLILLKIDLEKFENDHKKQLKLFGDPAYNKKSAVFTQEAIPTKYIEKIELS